MSAAASLEAVRRFHDILLFISHEPVRTAYEVARRLDLPLSSTYLAISEMERLNCLTRDENGFFLTGSRILKIGLNAHNINIQAQHLPPLIRYLRDRTGETSFSAVADARLIIGVVAVGTVPGHLAIHPFQTLALLKTTDQILPDGLMVFACAQDDKSGRGVAGCTQLDVYAIPLCPEAEGINKDTLLLCIAATAGQPRDIRSMGQALQDAKKFFDQSTNPKNP